jgi:hypothetical protein
MIGAGVRTKGDRKRVARRSLAALAFSALAIALTIGVPAKAGR